MKLRTPFVLAVLVAIFAVAMPVSAQDAVFQQCSSAEAAILPATGDDLGELFGSLQAGLDRGSVEYKQTGCTATYDCLTGQHLSCTGTSNCTPLTVACSTQGSTCPEQGATVGAVKCNGVIQATCPCPEVCFGCGVFCQNNTQCASVCSCGGGKCVAGRCSCRY